MSITSAEILDRINDLRSRNEEFCVVTVVRTANVTSAKAGAKALVTSGGEIFGFVGGGCVTGAVKRVAAEVLANGAPRLIRVKPKEDVVEHLDADGVELHKSSCPSGGTVELFIEPMRMAPRCIVCGASPVAAALVALANAMGYRTVAAALAEDHERVPGADSYLTGFDLEAANPVAVDAIVVSTQGKRDREALHAALSTDADYVAFVGSRRKAAALKSAIREKGLPAARVERLKAPAGLDIGAIEPEEIALSIMGEIVGRRREAMREKSGGAETADPPVSVRAGTT
jgi:xanthine dehydrogenase accessory factor